MRTIPRWIIVILVLLASWVPPPPLAQAANLDTTADRVFGQDGSFITALVNKGGLSATSLDNPGGVALDGGGNLYVADTSNHRALQYGLAPIKLYLPLMLR